MHPLAPCYHHTHGRVPITFWLSTCSSCYNTYPLIPGRISELCNLITTSLLVGLLCYDHSSCQNHTITCSLTFSLSLIPFFLRNPERAISLSRHCSLVCFVITIPPAKITLSPALTHLFLSLIPFFLRNPEQLRLIPGLAIRFSSPPLYASSFGVGWVKVPHSGHLRLFLFFSCALNTRTADLTR